MIMDLSRCGLFNKHLDYFFFFVKLVYIPVHPGFIDILSFELQCHPSNAPESWGGHYHCSPTFLFLFFFSKHKKAIPFQAESGAGLSYLFSPTHTPPFRRWSKMGVAGRRMSLPPVSKQKGLSVYIFDCRSPCLTGSSPDLSTFSLLSAKSQLPGSLSKSHPSYLKSVLSEYTLFESLHNT